MKSKSKILCIALLFSAYCCSPKGDGSVSIVNIGGNKVAVFSLNELSSNIATIPLSSLVEGCEMVQLDNRDEALIGRNAFTTVSEKYIGIRAQSQPYKLFDRSGKFLCDVGVIGRGPGEYTSIYDDIIDDKNELIYIAPFIGNILVYKTSGEFVKTIETSQRFIQPKLFLSDGILSVIHRAGQNDKAMVVQVDVNTGQVVKELAPPLPLVGGAQFTEGEIFNTRNTPSVFDFFHTSSDTLYQYDIKNNQILPVFTITYTGSEKLYKQYIQLNKELFMAAVGFLITDPETRRQYYGNYKTVVADLKSRTSSYANVVNDYFGGLPVPSSVVTYRNGYWVHNKATESLISDIEKHLVESNCSENDRQTLTKILSSLNAEDNNIVFIGKLKNELKTNLW